MLRNPFRRRRPDQLDAAAQHCAAERERVEQEKAKRRILDLASQYRDDGQPDPTADGRNDRTCIMSGLAPLMTAAQNFRAGGAR